MIILKDCKIEYMVISRWIKILRETDDNNNNYPSATFLKYLSNSNKYLSVYKDQ